MREKIWYEFVHYKYGDEYLVLYIDRLRLLRKTTNMLVIIFSTSGIFSWKLWAFFPVLTSALIAIIQLFRLIENQIIPNDKDLEQVALLRNMYHEYSNLLEHLWIEYNRNELSEKEASDQFFNLRKTEQEIKALNNKINIQEISKLQVKAETITQNYLEQYHLNS